MQQFIDKYASQIEGVLTGFDRLVFRGLLRRLNFGWWDANVKSFAPATSDTFTGIGTDAYGFITNTSGYTMWVLDSNLTFKIFLGAAGATPTPGRLRDAAVKMAPGTIGGLAAKA